ncbi:MAG TPA: outer membrane protein assembly factor BamA [Myxococcales bacterium]|nr:outer membrane protein assembly factor BamA [Myxococcales bacterium]
MGLLIAPLRPAAAQRAGQRPPKRPPEPGEKPQTPPAPPSPRQPPEPGLPPAIPGQAPSVPAGMTPEQAAAPAPDTGTIAKTNVQGNRRVEADAIRAALPLRVGDTFDKRKLKETLLAVWRMGYFNDVKLDVSAVPTPGTGYQLTVLVSEKPAMHDIKLEGNEELSKDDLKDTFEIKQFQILDQEGVRKTAKKIQEKYIEKGYFLAEVSTRLDPLPNNEVNVVFVINEHAKVTVKEIRFVGNRAISTDDLKSAMITQEGSFWSFLTNAGTYREDAFARDEYVLQGLYYDRGYLFVKFGKPAIELSPDRRYIFITIPIEEGDPYDIGKIDVTGDLLEPKETLIHLVETRPGARFSKTILQRDLQVLADIYKDKGYAYANVTPDTDVHAESKTVDVIFSFQKGNLVTIEKIEMLGNTKTRDKVIRRELRINEGDLYSGTGIRVSKARVTALGYFDSVEINQRRGSSDDKMVLDVTVKEKLTGTFQVGFGFTGGESFFGQAQLSQNNLLGYGHTATLSFQISSIRQLFQLSYLDPYFLDTNWTASIDLYRSELVFTGFDRKAIGGALTGGYEIFEDMRLFTTYTLENVDVVPNGNTALLLRNQFTAGRTSSIRFSLNYDKRDNRLFPTNGHLESASAEFATDLLGSQNLFQRYRLIERRYRPLVWGLVFKVNVSLGYIRATEPLTHPVAISEKFFAGGINSIRGYSLRSISPTKKIAFSRDPDAGLVDYAIGGNKELITNWEIEFPIVESAGIRGVTFFDAGNVFSESENFFQSSQRPDANGNGTLPFGLFYSVGFGVRWFSPLGPLRFEVGFPLTRRPIDEPYLFEFTIGNFF